MSVRQKQALVSYDTTHPNDLLTLLHHNCKDCVWKAHCWLPKPHTAERQCWHENKVYITGR